jgi:hypothetical protein
MHVFVCPFSQETAGVERDLEFMLIELVDLELGITIKE